MFLKKHPINWYDTRLVVVGSKRFKRWFVVWHLLALIYCLQGLPVLVKRYHLFGNKMDMMT